MECAPQAKIVFRVVPAQRDDDFVIFAIYPGLGAARFYRRARVVSRFAGAAGVLWRSCSKNPAGVFGLDAIVFRLRHGAAFRCGGIYLAKLVRARTKCPAAIANLIAAWPTRPLPPAIRMV